LWSPIRTEWISPRLLISRPICRLISRDRKQSCRDNSGVMTSAGAMFFLCRRSNCLICPAPSPVMLPESLLMAVFPHLLIVVPRSRDLQVRRGLGGGLFMLLSTDWKFLIHLPHASFAKPDQIILLSGTLWSPDISKPRSRRPSEMPAAFYDHA